jgi:hypothetical protein
LAGRHHAAAHNPRDHKRACALPAIVPHSLLQRWYRRGHCITMPVDSP